MHTIHLQNQLLIHHLLLIGSHFPVLREQMTNPVGYWLSTSQKDLGAPQGIFCIGRFPAVLSGISTNDVASGFNTERDASSKLRQYCLASRFLE
jgi:hypothetical protein